MYMDRTYLPQTQLLPVYDMGIATFRDVVFQHAKVRILSVVLEWVRKERDGEVISAGQIKDLVGMLCDFGGKSYEEDFEAHLLRQSADYYAQKSQEWLVEGDASVYLKHVESSLAQEDDRVKRYLSLDTLPKLRSVAETELLTNQLETIVNLENVNLANMLDQKRIADLNRMYLMFQRVDKDNSLLKAGIQKRIKDVSQSLNKRFGTSKSAKREGGSQNVSVESLNADEKKGEKNVPVQWVEAALELKTQYDSLLGVAFSSDSQFEIAMNEALESAINDNTKAPQFLSLYMNENLDKKSKKSEAELDVIINSSISLFRFIQDKDVFERFFKTHLAKRLLGQKSISDDTEQAVIAKLKVECGYQFTTKMEGMFNDMKLSADLQIAFKEHLNRSNSALSLDLSVNVLTSSCWPFNAAPADVPFTGELLDAIDAFTRFYSNRHTGRKLTFQSNMGTVEVKCASGKKPYELIVATYQALILLLFNEDEELTLERIEEASRLPQQELKRHLQSLACGKIKVLLKEPKSRDVNPGDKFKVNDGFQANQYRIKIPTIALKQQTEREEEAKDAMERVDEDRKHLVDASIVRIMKSRRTLEHTQLVVETTRQLTQRFQPDPQIIKQRIETLIDRDYLRRSDSDRKMYEYVA